MKSKYIVITNEIVVKKWSELMENLHYSYNNELAIYLLDMALRGGVLSQNNAAVADFDYKPTVRGRHCEVVDRSTSTDVIVQKHIACQVNMDINLGDDRIIVNSSILSLMCKGLMIELQHCDAPSSPARNKDFCSNKDLPPLHQVRNDVAVQVDEAGFEPQYDCSLAKEEVDFTFSNCASPETDDYVIDDSESQLSVDFGTPGIDPNQLSTNEESGNEVCKVEDLSERRKNESNESETKTETINIEETSSSLPDEDISNLCDKDDETMSDEFELAEPKSANDCSKNPLACIFCTPVPLRAASSQGENQSDPIAECDKPLTGVQPDQPCDSLKSLINFCTTLHMRKGYSEMPAGSRGRNKKWPFNKKITKSMTKYMAKCIVEILEPEKRSAVKSKDSGDSGQRALLDSEASPKVEGDCEKVLLDSDVSCTVNCHESEDEVSAEKVLQGSIIAAAVNSEHLEECTGLKLPDAKVPTIINCEDPGESDEKVLLNSTATAVVLGECNSIQDVVPLSDSIESLCSGTQAASLRRSSRVSTKKNVSDFFKSSDNEISDLEDSEDEYKLDDSESSEFDWEAEDNSRTARNSKGLNPVSSRALQFE